MLNKKSLLFTFVLIMLQHSLLFSGEYYYPIHDHLGSVRVVVDKNANVVEAFDYYPFGAELRSTVNDDQAANLRFTGKELDKESHIGLYYFGARYYDAEVGRFLGVDRFADKYPSMSPYQYAANNPLKFIDPTGETVQIVAGNDTVTYTVGMTYEGENKQMAGIINTLNSIGGIDIGNTVLSQLVDSEGLYNVGISQKLASNMAGGQFTGNKNGLGGNMLLNPAMISSVNKVAHEFFHGYQHDMGSGGASILSEVEAYLFGAAMQERVTGNPIHMFGDMSQAGNIYTNMMLSTLYAHQFVDVNAHFHSAMSTFKQGSYANKLSNGLYSNFPMRAQKQRVLINKFYPLLRK
jgi:RHS repeat-associated protein